MGGCALPASPPPPPPVGLDLQTQEAAEAVDVLGESWGSAEAGWEIAKEGKHDCSPSLRDSAKVLCRAAASILCPEGPGRLWTTQQQDLGGLRIAI